MMFRCLIPWRCSRQVEHIDRRHGNLAFIPDDIYRYERFLQELFLDANQIKDLPRVSEFALEARSNHHLLEVYLLNQYSTSIF